MPSLPLDQRRQIARECPGHRAGRSFPTQLQSFSQQGLTEIIWLPFLCPDQILQTGFAASCVGNASKLCYEQLASPSYQIPSDGLKMSKIPSSTFSALLGMSLRSLLQAVPSSSMATSSTIHEAAHCAAPQHDALAKYSNMHDTAHRLTMKPCQSPFSNI